MGTRKADNEFKAVLNFVADFHSKDVYSYKKRVYLIKYIDNNCFAFTYARNNFAHQLEQFKHYYIDKDYCNYSA